MPRSGSEVREVGASAAEGILASVRRLTAIADGATDAESVFQGLAAELSLLPGGDEVHVHHLARDGREEDLVVLYLFDGRGRLSYMRPLSERAPGVAWVASTGRPFLAIGTRELAASDPRMTVLGAGACALLAPVTVRSESEAVVLLVRRDGQTLREPDLDLASALIDQAATGLALVAARVEAGTDGVTGAMNHRAMHRRLQEEIVRAARGGSDLACMLIDLDNFKLVNDRHGHGAGDSLLREVVHVLIGEFRAFDRVARYGGDEFVVILPNADLADAAAAAERALEKLRRISTFELDAGVRASIGVSEWRPSMSSEQLLRACDDALLQAKRAGKDRVTKAPIG